MRGPGHELAPERIGDRSTRAPDHALGRETGSEPGGILSSPSSSASNAGESLPQCGVPGGDNLVLAGWRLMVAVVVAVASGVLLGAASPAHAGWQRSVQIGRTAALDAKVPVVTFDPAGNAAVAFGGREGSSGLGLERVYLVRRAAKGAFSAPELVPVSDPSLLGPPALLALPAGGDTVLLIYTDTYPSGQDSWEALVQQPGSPSFAGPQDLEDVTATNDPCCGELVADTAGETLGAFFDPSGFSAGSTWVLPKRHGAFRQLASPGYGGPAQLAADGVGGTFLTWVGGASNTTARLAYRRTDRRFGRARACPPCATGVLAAGGHAHAALALVQTNQRGDRLQVFLGGPSGFGRPHELARAAPGTGGVPWEDLTVAADGSVVVGWQQCGSRHCMIRVALGASSGRFGAPQTFTSAPTQGGSDFSAMAGDARGDVVIAWQDEHDDIIAAVRRAGAGRFGSPRRLSSRPIPYGHGPAVAFGPRGEAITTWLDPATGKVMGAVYKR